jgi:alpha-glucosidase
MREDKWPRRGVLYNAYPRSWQDSNGDGIGDIPGIVERLDYLEWLGVDGLWLNPITPSPNRDWGYDVTDYCDVHPDFGGLEDLDRLVLEAHRRDIRLILDVVPSHTSDEHPWFQDARRSRGSQFRDYYVWAEGRPDSSPPTNWLGYFGEPTWTRDERSGDSYLHNFSRHQPQLNWWNPEVHAQFDRIFRFWFDRGIDGLRIDALQALYYDRELRNNPSAGPLDSHKERELGQRFVFNANRPQVHEAIRSWRRLAGSYRPERLLFGETWVPTVEQLVAYYGSGEDELHLAWSLPFLTAHFSAPSLRATIGDALSLIPKGGTPTWAMSTHDAAGRAASRWCHGEDAAIRCALFVLLGLEGTSILYYGDEIGMLQQPADLLAGCTPDRSESRNASRTPMQWEDRPGGGFTASDRPWLPLGDTSMANVLDQRDDRASVLHLCRDLVRMRRELPPDPMKLLCAPEDILAWRYGEITLAVNLAEDHRELPVAGRIALCTERQREGERVERALRLAPLEGAIVT